MMRYPVFVAAAALLLAAPAFAQSTPETAAPAGPSVAPITGSSTVGQPGTPRTTPQARYHHILHRTAHHWHHRRSANQTAASAKSSKVSSSQPH
ncbi:MAG TPA: hypothetical protein VGG69_12255 [Rhizomicrobium sp.]